MTSQHADVAIIGGGIAGLSLAGRLAATHSVLVLETEEQPGTQATGRSAANWEPLYGPPLIRALTRASGGFLHHPPDGFAPAPLLNQRSVLAVGSTADLALVPALVEIGYRPIDGQAAAALIPPLRCDRLSHFLLDVVCADVDVDLLLHGWLRQLRAAGGRLLTRSEVQRGTFGKGLWTLETASGSVTAPIVVNAAGAWADRVAERLGATPIGLVPKRRSAAIVAGRGLEDVAAWSQIAAIDESFYAKPMGGKLMVSPGDADPVEPHDAWADDFKLAEAIEALQEVLDVEVTRIERSWGGLRSFVADGLPVVGFDSERPGLFWLAGQGGYGIQTAPAMSSLAAALIRGGDLAAELVAEKVTALALQVRR